METKILILRIRSTRKVMKLNSGTYAMGEKYATSKFLYLHHCCLEAYLSRYPQLLLTLTLAKFLFLTTTDKNEC
jgi:hypothetical protein